LGFLGLLGGLRIFFRFGQRGRASWAETREEGEESGERCYPLPSSNLSKNLTLPCHCHLHFTLTNGITGKTLRRTPTTTTTTIAPANKLNYKNNSSRTQNPNVLWKKKSTTRKEQPHQGHQIHPSLHYTHFTLPTNSYQPWLFFSRAFPTRILRLHTYMQQNMNTKLHLRKSNTLRDGCVHTWLLLRSRRIPKFRDQRGDY